MKKIDELVKRVEYFERLAVYGDRSTFLKRLAQVSNPATPTSFPGDLESPALQSPPVQTAKETVISVPQRIDPNVQDMLNRLLDGKIVPLLGDGQLGDQTRAALKMFKDTYHKPASIAAITEEFNKSKRPSNVVDLDPAAKQREQYNKSQSLPPGVSGSRT